jgi:hypothetical protein
MDKPSKLTSFSSFEEKQSLSNLLGPRKECLSSGNVQLEFVTSLSPLTWGEKLTGVACFVKDYARKGFFIEV